MFVTFVKLFHINILKKKLFPILSRYGKNILFRGIHIEIRKRQSDIYITIPN